VRALIPAATAATLALCGADLRVAAGYRAAAWPRPDDATVTAVLATPGHPAEAIATVTVAITNPSDSLVLVGISPRRRGWHGGGTRTMVPVLAGRRRHRANLQAVVCLVLPQSVGRLSVPIPGDRRCRLAVVADQSGRRLRVISVPVTNINLPSTRPRRRRLPR